MRLFRKETGYRLDAVGLKPSCEKKFLHLLRTIQPPPTTSITAGKVAEA
jgi:hypothetical protein